MQILKKSALVAAASLLSFTLSTFILAFGVWQVFGTSTQPKRALAESGIYTDLITGALDQSSKEQGKEGLDINNNAEVKNIIVGCFPPNQIQQQTETVIDDIYGWVQGKSPQLTFTFGLDQYKTCLSDSLSKYVQTRLSTLPPCTAANLPQGEMDPLSTTCRPPGVNVAAETEKFRQNILSGDFLGKNGQISAATLKNDKGQTLTEQLKVLPEAYKKTKQGIMVSAILALALTAAVILLSVNWRKGLKKVSIIYITVGGLMAALGWLAGAVIRRASNAVNQGTDLNGQLQHSSLSAVQILVDDLRNWWVGLGLGFVVLGIVTLLVLHFTKPKDEVKEEQAEKAFTDTKNDDKPETWAEKLTETSKSKSTTKPKDTAKNQK